MTDRDRLHEPHHDRLAPDHPRFGAIVDAHEVALAAGEAAYVDPVSGYQVFTAAELLSRGTCCSSGCRHCPYV